jgi:predicted nucleic acid-binding Zn ribbon protein
MATHKDILCYWCDNLISKGRKSDMYCSDECAYEEKLIKERERNRTKAHSHIILNNDEILHDLFIVHGSEIYISAKDFLVREFNWDLNRGVRIIEGVNAFILSRYAYTLFNNQTVRIWKL